jgi:sialidase-1
MKRSTDGGRTWSEQQVVYDEGGDQEITIGNPCPVLDRTTGTIWLPLTKDNDRVLMTHSADHGRTWGKPTDITADVKRPNWGWYATGPGVGIQLERGEHKGRLIIPCDHRCPEYDCGSHVISSDDHGKTWRLSENFVQPGANECQVVELADGSLLLNARMQENRQTGRRGTSLSRDGGRTWSALSQESGPPDPRVQASFLRYRLTDRPQGNVLLFSNPSVPLSMQSGKRIDLTVQASFDEGGTWPVRRMLHAGPSAYSCLVALPDGAIGCLYEAGDKSAYETLLFSRSRLDMLTAQ